MEDRWAASGLPHAAEPSDPGCSIPVFFEMRVKLGRIGFREVRGQCLANFGSDFGVNGVEQLIVDRTAYRNGATSHVFVR